MGTMNKILILLGITTLVFLSVCFGFIWNDKIIPDSLIYSYFAAIGTEGFVMGWIKNAKCKVTNIKLKEDETDGTYNK